MTHAGHVTAAFFQNYLMRVIILRQFRFSPLPEDESYCT
jgi:hypothetical protein